MGRATLTPEQTARVVDIALDLARAGDTDQLIGFLAHGLPADTADPGGNTLVMLASYHGQAGTVRALLERGADPDRTNGRGQTPLAGALFKGADDVVTALLEAGADLDTGTPTARAAATVFGRAHLLVRQ
ncbi:ankyrin repeat domain-containing protein [Streptomyces sp. NPDC057694]|uniref:ankyrin repeat domain-containing protein n=1 Tax=Streptomyces sp. NPDC057694 TaxID=3346216 RepID=UPI00368971CF